MIDGGPMLVGRGSVGGPIVFEFVLVLVFVDVFEGDGRGSVGGDGRFRCPVAVTGSNAGGDCKA